MPVSVRFVSAAVRTVPALRLPLVPPCRLSAALALAAAVGFHVWVYALIGQNEAVRMEQIDLAVRGEISSAVFPTESESLFYFWGRNPGNPDRVQKFPAFLWPAGAC